MKVGLVIAAVALLAFPAAGWGKRGEVHVNGSQPKTVIANDLGGGLSYPYQSWVDMAKVPTPDVTLTVVERSAGIGNPGAFMLEWPGIWLDPAQLVYPRETFLHELGHAFEHLAATDQQRYAFASIYGGWDDEAFATAYAVCALGDKSFALKTRPATRRELRTICNLLRV